MVTNETLSMTHEAYKKLEHMIIFKELTPGAMYSEKTLADTLQLGRTPVREALKMLDYEQMVKIHSRRGIQIPEISVESQLKLLEVRRMIEAMCVELATERADDDQRNKMLSLANDVTTCAKSKDDELFLSYLKQIHRILIEASRNDYIEQAMKPLQGLTRRFWFTNNRENILHPAELHADVMRCVAAGDKKTAKNAVNALNDYLTEFTYNCLGFKG